jgi:hypothetical protein
MLFEELMYKITNVIDMKWNFETGNKQHFFKVVNKIIEYNYEITIHNFKFCDNQFTLQLYLNKKNEIKYASVRISGEELKGYLQDIFDCEIREMETFECNFEHLDFIEFIIETINNFPDFKKGILC